MRSPLFKRRLRKIFANKHFFSFFLSCFLTTASFFLFFLLPTTQSAHNNSRLCINLVLIDSSRLSMLNTVSTACCHAFISVVFEASEWRLSSNFKVKIDESFSWKDAFQVKAVLWTPLRYNNLRVMKILCPSLQLAQHIKGTVSRYCACTKLWFLDRMSRNQKMRGE